MSTTSSSSTSGTPTNRPGRSGPAASGNYRWCAGCCEEQVFEVPPCEDGHGEDCLDLACVECGHALVVGILVADDEVLVTVQAA